jgi:tetratricopeptide (TPR) repeat protein
MGEVHLAANDPGRAEKSFRLALDMYQFKEGRKGVIFRRGQPANQAQLAAIYMAIARSNEASGDLDGAAANAGRAAKVIEEEDPVHAARAYLESGLYLEDADNLDGSRKAIERAVALLRTSEEHIGEIVARLNLARVHEKSGSLKKAITCLDKAKEVARKAGERNWMSRIRTARSRLEKGF